MGMSGDSARVQSTLSRRKRIGNGKDFDARRMTDEERQGAGDRARCTLRQGGR